METFLLVLSILNHIIHASTPLLILALGELIVEKSGIINLGLEGMMLFGAFIGFLVTFYTKNPFLGFIISAIVTGLFSLIHGFLTVTLLANQIVSGLALTMLGVGITSFFGKDFINKKITGLSKIEIPILSNIPILGEILFKHNIIVYISIILVVLTYIFIYKTKYGLFVQFCGENPDCAQTAGVDVVLVRYSSIFLGGVLAGISGAYLTLADNFSWQDNISAGRGWIAISIVIFSRWHPIGIIVGSYFFGAFNSLQFRLQAIGINISSYLLNMLPYIFTILALIFSSIFYKKQKSEPEALGEPFIKESRD